MQGDSEFPAEGYVYYAAPGGRVARYKGGKIDAFHLGTGHFHAAPHLFEPDLYEFRQVTPADAKRIAHGAMNGRVPPPTRDPDPEAADPKAEVKPDAVDPKAKPTKPE